MPNPIVVVTAPPNASSYSLLTPFAADVLEFGPD
jgi:hypothetical protein